MKIIFIQLYLLGLLPAYFQSRLVSKPIAPAIETQQEALLLDPELELKQAAFEGLKTKCNVCHRKKNPFRISR